MLATPNCYTRKCKHFQGVKQDDGTEASEIVVCKAFPEGIPPVIAYEDNKHLEPFKGDHGIQFEEQEEA